MIAMALLGFGLAAATAQATSGLRWAKNGHHLSAGTNPTLIATGKFKFSNVTTGGTECPAKAEITLTGGSGTAHLNEITITNTAECVLNGPLASACAKITGDEVTGTGGKPLSTANGGAWSATGTLNSGVASLDVTSEITIHNTYKPKEGEAGKLCPKKGHWSRRRRQSRRSR